MYTIIYRLFFFGALIVPLFIDLIQKQETLLRACGAVLSVIVTGLEKLDSVSTTQQRLTLQFSHLQDDCQLLLLDSWSWKKCLFRGIPGIEGAGRQRAQCKCFNKSKGIISSSRESAGSQVFLIDSVGNTLKHFMILHICSWLSFIC